LRADCSTVGLYCVTITWQQIVKGLLEVAVEGVLQHVQLSVEPRLGRYNATRQWLLVAIGPRSYTLCEKNMSESAAMLPPLRHSVVCVRTVSVTNECA